jgi:hypothetical protein
VASIDLPAVNNVACFQPAGLGRDARYRAAVERVPIALVFAWVLESGIVFEEEFQ